MYGDALKKALKEKNITAAQLSVLTGIGKSSISQYLSGKFTPSDERKKVIAESLGLPVEFFDSVYVTKDGKSTKNLPVSVAAKLMGKPEQFIRLGLQRGVFPFGYAVNMGKQWSYFISPVQFCKATGFDIDEVF